MKAYDIVIDVVLTERDSFAAAERYSYRFRTPVESLVAATGDRDQATAREVLSYVDAAITSALKQSGTLIPKDPLT